MTEFAWTPEACDKLTALWHRGVPADEIADQLGTTFCSVMSKRQRLDLPRRCKPGRPSKQRKARLAQMDDGLVRQCRWPKGEPTEPDFGFCGAHAVPGKPYCPEHCARAYVGVSA